MLKPLLQIRLRQIVRAIGGLSWYYFPLFSGLLLFLTGWLYHLLLQPPLAIGTAAAALLLVLALHLYRTDKRFLALLSQRPFLLFWAEYTLLLLPLLLLLALTANWVVALLTTLALLPLSCLGFDFPKARKAMPIVLVAAACFEWKAGVRKYGWLLALLYLAALALCFYPVVSLLLLWFITVLVSTFYQECEPVHLLVIPEKSPQAFLHYKLRLQLQQYVVLTLPLLLLYCLLHPAHALLAIAVFYPLLLLVLASSILTKYAHYEPNQQVSSAASFLNGLDALSPLLPFLLLFPLVNAVRSYKKAVHRLNPYLDDFN